MTVVGAGPAGLAAAVYASSEGLRIMELVSGLAADGFGFHHDGPQPFR